MTFDTIAILDWSAAGRPTTGANSIWLAVTDTKGTRVENIATRAAAQEQLCALAHSSVAANQRLLIGADFSFGYPAGFAAGVTGSGAPLDLWAWLSARHPMAADNSTPYRTLAAQMNALFDGDGPFWGNTAQAEVAGLGRTKPALPAELAQWRACEQAAQASGLRPSSCWQLAGAGAVGAQMLTGLPVLQHLRDTFGADLSVWPFQPADAAITLAEVYPSILAAEVRAAAQTTDAVVDAIQVETLARALWALNSADQIAPLLDRAALPPAAMREGWILGQDHQIALRRAVPPTQTPPRLRDDCFAMPRGVNWVPVDTALETLRGALMPIKGHAAMPLHHAQGRVMAKDAIAQRANPPRPNSAVDGYGFAHVATGAGPQRLPLVPGRAAAGQPYDDTVPMGAAVRILTGAILPDGVDTVVLEEDTANDGATVVFDGPVKSRANTRKAGEDMAAGATAIRKGHTLRAPDVALLSALGIPDVTVFDQLRVGVVSTGDEIIARPNHPALPHQIYDANRPMLLGLAAGWGYDAVDLGHVRDDPRQIEQRLNSAAKTVDVILTSGGASAGDEDHVSSLLRAKGTLHAWRIALKPGRPLALAMWNGVPVFGLPGNPVAALVCALIFARPALSLMAGSGWCAPTGFTVPAAFQKTKKPGRREYLRARLNADGHAEVFQSEGSGRISGLSWAEGLVELPDAASTVTQGTPVRYLPYAMLGLH